MTPVDILVIVLCVVVVSAVAAGTVIRKIKGKPSSCSDCAHCSAACPSHSAARGTQNKRSAAGEKDMTVSEEHVCAGNCHGCTGCAHSLHTDKRK